MLSDYKCKCNSNSFYDAFIAQENTSEVASEEALKESEIKKAQIEK